MSDSRAEDAAQSPTAGQSPAATPPDAPTGPSKPRADRTLLIVLTVVGVLVVAALVAVFARGSGPAYDANSPEGVVQRYVSAIVAGDYESARDLHELTHSTGCEPVSAFVSSDSRVTLVSSTQSGDSATVTVTINDGYGGPFGGDGGYEDRFGLTSSGGEWLVAYTPWLFQVCMEEVRG